MAFNKAKAIEDAQKLVSQNKLKDAISSYGKILAKEPRDQNVLNALGDLHARLNAIPEALEYYTKLADVYASDGFLVRGIAMYKKISKLDPSNMRALERLAELYTMQGMVGDARAHYLQLVEASLKANNATKAMEILQKVLDLDPHNIKIQMRLAELYERHGQPVQAAGVYRRLADHALAEGRGADSEKWLQKALVLAPDSPDVVLLQARQMMESGRAADALAVLKKLPKVEEHAEASELLLTAHLAAGNAIVAEELAEKLFSTDQNRFGGLLQLALHSAREKDAARAVGYLERVREVAFRLDPLHLLDIMREIAATIPDSAEALELVARTAREAQHQPALVEALKHQADLAASQQDFARAREIYNELISIEPQNPEFTRGLNRVRQQLGEEVPAAEMEAAAAMEAAAPIAEPELDEETQAFVNATMTDIDLFSSYGMADKAIELCVQLLERVPHHIGGNEKLLDLYLGSGNDAGVAEVANRLEPLLRAAGNRPRADEVMSLAARYAEKAGVPLAGAAPAAAPAPAPEAPVAEATFEIPLAAPAAPPAPASHEVDLSAEWNMAAPAEEAAAEFPMEAAIPAPAGLNAEEVAQEIEFYLAQGLVDQARTAIARYRTDYPDEAILDELSARVESAIPAAEEAVAEESAGLVAEIPLGMETEGSVAEISLEPAIPEPAAVEEETEPALAAAAADDGDTYEVVLEEPAKEGAPAAAGAPMSATDFFSDLAGDLDQVLEGAQTQAPPPATAKPAPPRAPAAAAPAAPAGEGTPLGVLQEVFDEFKGEMGGQEEDVDIESHYNLGIAYKEMGLLDEAISEFQKVTKAAERLKAHNQVFQACTLLGLCFVDKGHPQIAVRWYERALKTPGVDEEAQLALRYDMGTAHEQAGNRKAALDCFMEVYGVNVDYRDVGDRIRELQGA